VPGDPDNIHSRWSEGFRILATLTFLGCYLHATHQTHYNSNAQVQGFCDNLGLIQNVNWIKENNIPDSSQAIAHDYNRHQEIAQAIQKLPIKFSLQHVKGHQDATGNHDNTP